jgi:hypothetical protein
MKRLSVTFKNLANAGEGARIAGANGMLAPNPVPNDSIWRQKPYFWGSSFLD